VSLPRVMLADDHTILVEAFRKLLESRCEIVGTVSDGQALLDLAPKLKPDVILLDISMPLLNGLEAGKQLKSILPAVKVVILTMNEDPDFAVEAMQSMASGYLLKKSAASELFHAIQQVLKGKSYVTPQIARGMRHATVRHPQDSDKTLTARQRDVIQLLAQGKSMKEAADLLNVTARTVAFHKYRIMGQLKLKTTADLIHFAIRTRIVVDDPSRHSKRRADLAS
jgi:DNA-binding NarL/FixJ family response regulator